MALAFRRPDLFVVFPSPLPVEKGEVRDLLALAKEENVMHMFFDVPLNRRMDSPAA